MDDSDRKMIGKIFDDIPEDKLRDIVNKVLEIERNSKRKFVILMDFENFERGRTHKDELLDISWLTNPIFEVGGEIVQSIVFLPEYMGQLQPIKVLSNIHRFLPVFGTSSSKSNYKREADEFGVGVRDTDTVDSRMDEYGTFIVDYCPEVTDIVLITGDGGFQKLLKHAEYHGKTVWIFSAIDALAMRFDLQRSNPNVKVETVA